MKSLLIVLTGSALVFGCNTNPSSKSTKKDTTAATSTKGKKTQGKKADPKTASKDKAAAPAKVDNQAKLAKAMVGQWQSACFASNGSFAQLNFDLKANKWSLDYKSFADKDCKTGTTTAAISGAWKLTQNSKVGDGVYEAEFGFATRTITPHIAGAIQFLSGLKPCGGESPFELGKAKSIQVEGCPGIGMHPAEKCSTDFDIVTVKDGMLFFGERPKDNNMCSADKRPTKLMKYGLKRI